MLGTAFTVLGQVLLPVFSLIALGWFLRRRGILNEAGGRDLGQLLYWVCLPAQLFLLTSRVDLAQALSGRALAAIVAGLTAGMAAGWWLTARMPAAARGCVMNGAGRGNGAFIGLPVIQLAAVALAPAQRDALVGIYAVLLGPSVIAFNVAAVIAFRLPHHGVTWAGVAGALRDLVRSPLIAGCAFGSLLGWWRPGVLTGTAPGAILELLAATAVPLALLSAGRDLDLGHLREHPRIIAATVGLKLVAVPALAWGLCRWAGVEPLTTCAVTILMASPAAIASVPMARLLGGDAGLMAALVTATTVGAPLTMLGWLLVVGP